MSIIASHASLFRTVYAFVVRCVEVKTNIARSAVSSGGACRAILSALIAGACRQVIALIARQTISDSIGLADEAGVIAESAGSSIQKTT